MDKSQKTALKTKAAQKFMYGKQKREKRTNQIGRKFQIGERIRFLNIITNELKPCLFLGRQPNGHFKISVPDQGFLFLERQYLYDKEDNNDENQQKNP